MARITVEDALKKAKNRFALVLLGAKRTKQLLKGSKPLVESSNREVVTSLREIAVGKVTYTHPEFLRGGEKDVKLVKTSENEVSSTVEDSAEHENEDKNEDES
jgi:DNA-directed RNA polymerase subunit omega